MSDIDRLVDRLAGELEPVRAAGDVRLPLFLWFVFSALFVVAVIHLGGPVRPTAIEQLQSSPRFALEMLLGAGALVMLAVTAFHAAIPGRLRRVNTNLAVVLALLWSASFVLSLFLPALEPGMLGKRGHCYLETLLAAVPPLLVALWWQRRHYALAPYRAALGVGFVAAGFSALYMQVACMYLPMHNLLYHLGPAFVVALCAPLILWVWERLASRA